MEADAADLGPALEHAIAGNAETQNTIKKYQLQVRDAQKNLQKAERSIKELTFAGQVPKGGRSSALFYSNKSCNEFSLIHFVRYSYKRMVFKEFIILQYQLVLVIRLRHLTFYHFINQYN